MYVLAAYKCSTVYDGTDCLCLCPYFTSKQLVYQANSTLMIIVKWILLPTSDKRPWQFSFHFVDFSSVLPQKPTNLAVLGSLKVEICLQRENLMSLKKERLKISKTSKKFHSFKYIIIY